MIRTVKANERRLTPFPLDGAQVRVSDPLIAADRNLSVGFTEYHGPSDFSWTFDYCEAFLIIDGALRMRTDDGAWHAFGAGDLGFIEKGTRANIVVEQRAYLLHVTQPAWSGAET